MSRPGPVTVTAVRTSANVTVRKQPVTVTHKILGNPASASSFTSSSSSSSTSSTSTPPCSSPSFVHSRVTLYHASKIDLRYCRSLHSCGACRLGHTPALPCGAVHYGMCAPVPPLPARQKQQQQRVTLRRSISSPGPSSPTGGVRSHPPAPTARHAAGSHGAASPISPTSARYSSSVHLNTSPGTNTTPRGLVGTAATVTTSTSASTHPQHPESGPPPPPPRRSLSAPASRSLTILREGHELAGAPYAASSGGFLVPTSPMSPGGGGGQFQYQPSSSQQHPGLLRLHPQGRQQLVINSQNLRGLAAMGDVYPPTIVDTPRLGVGGAGSGGGVAITIQQHGGRTNITSSGMGGASPDIKIEGDGHEIVIQGGGRQNIRVSQPWSVGGRQGPIIRIQGQGHQGHVQYRPGVGVVVTSPPESPSPGTVTSPTPYIVTSPPPTPPNAHPQPALFEYPDTPLPPSSKASRRLQEFLLLPQQQSFPPAPKSFSSTTQIVPKKPTARVTPSPFPAQTPAPQAPSLSPAPHRHCPSPAKLHPYARASGRGLSPSPCLHLFPGSPAQL
ncbi:hypothetical protein EGW08_021222 [Elysia chlorotica]|uniref:Uncharacterized protein n=1 Tax=Elysia chlorotica TaxID=188477 RepID=A0A433SP72_ELYCH|nr:hypothetical protein EGW08_021222 [Elysia chlorotica]